MTGSAEVIRANSRHLPLADNTVDLVVTSPPYFALRSYQDGGEHYAGQIGDEPTPAEFVASLLEVTAECVRVLKPSGSLWVNLGDKYAGGGGYSPDSPSNVGNNRHGDGRGGVRSATNRGDTFGLRTKSLIGIPWRYALACIDDLGLILRAEVIWSKPNGLPESVTDRVRRSHEQWFHFTLEPRYFSAVDEIREAHSQSWGPIDRVRGRRNVAPDGTPIGGMVEAPNPLGKLPGSVWTIPTEPLRVPDHLGIDHFAAFPTAWPKRIIAGWSPAGICVECGEGRRPVVSAGASFPRDEIGVHRNGKVTAERGDGTSTNNVNGQEYNAWRAANPHRLTGYACACPEPTADTTPAVVLDPFGGTGTTALVAKALGRHGITVDMSADYCRLATWRTNDRDQLAKVLGIDKAPAIHDDEQSLFDLEEPA
jgi:DNA modification methylase